MNNKLPPVEILCGKWVWVSRSRCNLHQHPSAKFPPTEHNDNSCNQSGGAIYDPNNKAAEDLDSIKEDA